MELSIFEVLGPVMIGPSSSHTAGAVRLAKVAAQLAEKPFGQVRFGLSGSFAKTRRGHGTDLALLAGVMGLAQDDERIQGAYHLAKECGLEYEFHTEELDLMHENSVHITFFHFDDTKSEVWGSSTGGGRILISRINDFEAHLFGENPTMLVRHLDRPGVISEITRVLAENGLNIGVFRLARRARGDVANATIIVDSPIPPEVADAVRRLDNVEGVVTLDIS